MYIRNTTYHSDTFLMPIIIYSFNHHDTIPHQSSPLASLLFYLCVHLMMKECLTFVFMRGLFFHLLPSCLSFMIDKLSLCLFLSSLFLCCAIPVIVFLSSELCLMSRCSRVHIKCRHRDEGHGSDKYNDVA